MSLYLIGMFFTYGFAERMNKEEKGELKFWKSIYIAIAFPIFWGYLIASKVLESENKEGVQND